jgi:eukaryotic-like serine/threonine-protein kinase
VVVNQLAHQNGFGNGKLGALTTMSDQSEQPVKLDTEEGLSGRLLGDFRLIRRLGRGAMAEIYLAEQISLKRRVAVKILKPDLANDPTYLQRFEIEAQAAASLVHANIVQIYEVGHIERRHYIAQEYVQGLNLREWLARNGPPDLAHSLSIMRQVAAALAKAAEVGVVHRDIKPENIMITNSGEVKVADFGLARLNREGMSTDLTQIGITLGTPLYMSPEQVEGKPLDHRSDIYSFGITCYQMLSGSPPFTGETALAVAVQHIKTQPKPLETIRSDLPPALCRLVHTMLVKDPARRCQSARDILRELRRLQMEVFGKDWPEDLPGWDSGVGDTPLISRSAVTQEIDNLMKTQGMHLKRRRPFRWLFLAAAVVFLLGMVLAKHSLSDTFLLEDAKNWSNTPKKSSVLQQWYYASKVGTEPAWNSIKKYYGNKSYFVERANQQLALIYLREKRNDEANDIFDELVNLGDEDSELRTFGLAGKGVVLSRQGKYRESGKWIDEFLAIMNSLSKQQVQRFFDSSINSQMQRYVDEAIYKNRVNLGATTDKNK